MPPDTEPEHCRIRKLPPLLVDQIAAGEVVERPASVVKELLENALDAEADSIHIELSGGGMDEILISDNGTGMSSEELFLCVEQHATSKLARAEDLASIRTFGFRGEAVSSIASVADLEIQSRRRGAPGGFRFRVRFGERETRPAPCAAPEGTRFQIRDLFSRIPARRKFLRSAGTELSHCTRLSKEIAMGNPGVRFSLSHQGRRLFEFLPTSREKRVTEATRWKWTPIEVKNEIEGIRFHALLWDPRETPGKNEWYIFVNRRPIRNRNLFGLIKGLYAEADLLPSGILYLDIREDWLDVNVHPQKWEVRFWQQERVFPWIRSTLRKELSSPIPVQRNPRPTRSPSAMAQADFFPPPVGRLHGVLDSGHLLLERNSSLFIVNGPKLPAALLFQRLCDEYTSGSLLRRECPSALLFHVTGTHPWEALVAENESRLRKLGFELEFYGAGDACLRAYPEPLSESEAIQAASVLLPALASGKDDLALLALVAGSRRETPLQADEAEALLRETPELPLRGPDGHALVFELNSETIHNYFER